MRTLRLRAVAVVASIGLAAAGLVTWWSAPAGATVVNDEATFRAAWTNAAETQIDLAADVTLTCTDAGGDGVSVRSSATPITVNGHGHTITQACTTGTNNAVLEQDSTGSLSFDSVTIAGGNAGHNGGGIDAIGAGVAVTNSTISGNGSGNGGGIGGGAVTVTNSTVGSNSATNGGGGIFAGSVTITNSTVSNNTATNGGGGVSSLGQATVTNSTVSNNNVTNNVTEGFGGGIDANGGVTLTNSTVSNNTAGQSGGGGGVNALGAVTVTNSTVSGNTAPSGGGIFTLAAVTVTNSTVSNNTASQGVGGGVNAAGGTTLVYATVASNSAPTGSNVNGFGSGALSSFGSVVALPAGGGTNCAGLSGTTSNGYNFSDDSSCGFTGTGDRQSAGNPGLGALANNGGPTQTRLPQPSSPLIDAVPLTSCQADGAAGITTDQRGLSRPSGHGCDTGSVEVQQTPQTKDDCKNGGWQFFVDNQGHPFLNQGDCVSFAKH